MVCLQAAYDGSYLAKQLDIGTGAALASDTGAAKTIGRALVGAARVFTDKVRFARKYSPHINLQQLQSSSDS